MSLYQVLTKVHLNSPTRCPTLTHNGKIHTASLWKASFIVVSMFLFSNLLFIIYAMLKFNCKIT